MNALNNPKFLLNNKTFQTIYGRNLLHELNIIIPNETLIVTMEDLWDDFSNFFTKNVQVHLVKNLDINTLESDYEKIKILSNFDCFNIHGEHYGIIRFFKEN